MYINNLTFKVEGMIKTFDDGTKTGSRVGIEAEGTLWTSMGITVANGEVLQTTTSNK